MQDRERSARMSDLQVVGGGKRGFRRGMLIFATFVALVAAYIVCWSQAGFPSEWRLIRKGMTRAQVEALTGSRLNDLTVDIIWMKTYQPSRFASEYTYDLTVVFTPPAYLGGAGLQTVVLVQVSRWNQFTGWLRSIRDPNLVRSSQLDPPPPSIYEVK